MKKTLVLILTISILTSCSSEHTENDSISSEEIKKEKEPSLLDTSFTTIMHEHSNIKKEEGLLINKQKIGLWKEFNKSGDITKAVHYLNNEIEFELDINELKYDSIDIKSHNLRLNIPKTFEKVNTESENVLLVFKRSNCSKDVFCPNYNMTFSKINFNLKDSINSIINTLNLRFEKLKLINVEPKALGDIAYKITFTGRIENTKLAGVILFFQKKDILYNFSYLGNNEVKGGFIKQKDVVDEIINSIRFTSN